MRNVFLVMVIFFVPSWTMTIPLCPESEQVLMPRGQMCWPIFFYSKISKLHPCREEKGVVSCVSPYPLLNTPSPLPTRPVIFPWLILFLKWHMALATHPTPSPPSPTHLLSSVKGKKEKISGYRLKLRWGAAKIKGTVQLKLKWQCS